MFRADQPIPTALRALLLAILTLVAVAAPARAQLILEKDEVRQLKGVDLVEHLGAQIPLDASFTDAHGQTATLSQYFNDGKPAILALVYYECPIVCTMVLDQIVSSLNKLDYVVGQDYRLIVVSFDHDESTTHAYGQYLRSTRHYTVSTGPEVAQGMVFHTGDETNIQRLTQAVGWNFAPLPNGEWSHPVGLTVLSPQGKITRYMYGYEYPADQLKLTLLEATEGKIAKSLGERIMHYCFRYDPTAGAYSLEAMALMRLGGILTVILLAVLITALLLGERVRNRARNRADSKNLTEDDRGPSPADRFVPNPAGQVS